MSFFETIFLFCKCKTTGGRDRLSEENLSRSPKKIQNHCTLMFGGKCETVNVCKNFVDSELNSIFAIRLPNALKRETLLIFLPNLTIRKSISTAEFATVFRGFREKKIQTLRNYRRSILYSRTPTRYNDTINLQRGRLNI